MEPLHLTLTLTAEQIAAIAARVSEQIAPPGLPPYLTPGEAAEYLRCSRKRIYDLTSMGRLPALKDGSRSLYKRTDLDAYLDA